MNKKKIRLISIIVAVALAVGVGGLVYGVTIDHEHGDHGGHKLIA